MPLWLEALGYVFLVAGLVVTAVVVQDVRHHRRWLREQRNREQQEKQP